MLRNFYLILLLLCIEWSISFNYIDEESVRHYNNFGRHVKRSKKLGKNKIRKNLIHRDYNYDRMPIEFDLASFIQPDEEAIEEDDGSRNINKKRQRISNNDASLVDMNMDDKTKASGDSAADRSPNQPYYKDTKKSKHQSSNSLDQRDAKTSHDKYRNLDDIESLENDLTHSTEKKCVFKHIKLPFFSRNKSGTLEGKKSKKRKLFCFNCPKKESLSHLEANKTQTESLQQFKIKRSCEERLCPACRKRFITFLKPNYRLKKNPMKIIHNSRQFQQDVQSEMKDEEQKKIKQLNIDDLEELPEEGNRKKRDGKDNRQRQLKELNEVQRKVESVIVPVPKYEPLPDKVGKLN